jgi:flagella basal body P-ring formation protein FlgA
MLARRGGSLPWVRAAGLTLCCASLLGAQQDSLPRAARLMPRGTVITADDIMVLGDSLPRTLPIGWITRRVVQSGEMLRPPAIGRAPVITSGTRVTITAGTARIAISRSGTALADGAPGDTIPVRVDRASSISAIVRDSLTVVPLASSRP